jgi:hypothetical protein
MIVPRTQAVPVASVPEGAEVFVDGELVGTTPITVELSTTSDHEVMIRNGSAVRSWTLTRQVGAEGTAGFVLDGVVLTGSLGVAALGALLSIGTPDDGRATATMLLVVAVGATPLVVDLAADQYYELVPREIAADFE